MRTGSPRAALARMVDAADALAMHGGTGGTLSWERLAEATRHAHTLLTELATPNEERARDVLEEALVDLEQCKPENARIKVDIARTLADLANTEAMARAAGKETEQ